MTQKKINNGKSEEIANRVKADCLSSTISFGEKIKKQRENLNLSMGDLYKLSGVSSSTICDVEKGRYLPHVEVMLKLGYALDLSFNEVLSYLAPKPVMSIDEKRKSNMSAIKTLLRGMGFSEDRASETINYINYQLSISKSDTNNKSKTIYK